MADPTDPPDDEPRARDVAAAKSTADLEERLDPETVRQLAAWFGLPSYQQLEEERAAANAPTEDSERAAEIREMEAKIDAVVDRELLDRIFSWPTAGDAMFDEIVPPELHLRERLLLSDERFSEVLGAIGEPREVQIPRELEEDLQECTPQAMLRDLYRPEPQFDKYLTYGEPEPTPASLIADIRTIACADYTVRPEPSARTRYEDALAELRRVKALPWGDLSKPKPRDETSGEEPGEEAEP